MGINRIQNYFLISSDQELKDMLVNLWPEKVQWTVFEQGKSAIERIFNNPPDMLIVDLYLSDLDGVEIVKLVKSENVYKQLPVVVCLQDTVPKEIYDFSSVEIDEFLLRPISPEEAKARLNLTWHRSTRALDANPLTKLPGNTTIIHYIQELIDNKTDFALAYLDLDNFKAFNDKYGFSRGDEVLNMTARIIVNTIRSFVAENGFIGHIGGDDFVFILSAEQIEPACQSIIKNFDSIVPLFFDAEDRDRGYITSVDRQGNQNTFPLMSVSIAVVFNIGGSLEHYGQASQTAMNIKKKAKQDTKSNYVLDKRNTT